MLNAEGKKQKTKAARKMPLFDTCFLILDTFFLLLLKHGINYYHITHI
jgi:hypothetical protein